jgi:hypothetical protein
MLSCCISYAAGFNAVLLVAPQRVREGMLGKNEYAELSTPGSYLRQPVIILIHSFIILIHLLLIIITYFYLVYYFILIVINIEFNTRYNYQVLLECSRGKKLQ